MLDKETWTEDYWFLFFICSLFWFLYIAKCEFSSKLRVYIKDWSPSSGSSGSYLFRKYSSLHTQSLNNICTVAIPGQILACQCSRRGVELSPRLHGPHPKPQPGHFNNSTTWRPRREKPLQTSGSPTFLPFSCFSIANQEAVSRSAALLLRIKALALQKPVPRVQILGSGAK